ncbi:hypothetical protein AQUCO_05000005v1 [Aquilegia coerulea]|uniref:Uncharacterized protein n=1 Tax=Aquilegia coerulea TaxID=218851 RepID=A0A2G5CJ72_AQUCA|nr:hypothetical protein AQUCO_05000005v1 [Aquilegia coerulea]
MSRTPRDGILHKNLGEMLYRRLLSLVTMSTDRTVRLLVINEVLSRNIGPCTNDMAEWLSLRAGFFLIKQLISPMLKSNRTSLLLKLTTGL